MSGRRDQKFCHVKTNTARANQCHTLANGVLAVQHIDVTQHAGQVLAGNARVARLDPCGQHHVIIFLGDQIGRVDPFVQMQLHAGQCCTLAKVAQRFFKFFFARYPFGHVELAAYPVR